MAKNKEIEGELIPKDQGGRPSKFKKEHIGEILDLMQQGYTNTRICATLNIPGATFYRWINENEDMKEAYEIGKEKREAWWEEVGMAGMMGKIPRFNATVYDKLTKQKLNWKDDDDKVKGTQINIENMQVLQNMQQLTDGELDKKIQVLLDNLGFKDESDDTQQTQERVSHSSRGKGEEEEV